ncbi:mCG63875 [Mus musculus]|nr:mCG63875 [Mus musculus]
MKLAAAFAQGSEPYNNLQLFDLHVYLCTARTECRHRQKPAEDVRYPGLELQL